MCKRSKGAQICFFFLGYPGDYACGEGLSLGHTRVQTANAPSLVLIRAIMPAVKDYAWGIRGLDSRVAR